MDSAEPPQNGHGSILGIVLAPGAIAAEANAAAVVLVASEAALAVALGALCGPVCFALDFIPFLFLDAVGRVGKADVSGDQCGVEFGFGHGHHAQTITYRLGCQ